MYVSLSSLTDADLLLSPPPQPPSPFPATTTTTTTTEVGTTKSFVSSNVQNVIVSCHCGPSATTTTTTTNQPQPPPPPTLWNVQDIISCRCNVDPYNPTTMIRTSASAYASLTKPPIVNRPSVSASSSSSAEFAGGAGLTGLVPLPYDYIPTPYDVICGRGKAVSDHSGNIRFRDIIESRLDEYKNAICKLDKSLIVSSIIDTITATDHNHPNKRNSCNGGNFIKQINGRWYQVDNHFAREKCGQSFRDLLHNTYKSSTKAKAGRRKVGSNNSNSSTSSVRGLAAAAAVDVIAPNHPNESHTNGTPSSSIYSNNATIGTGTGSSISTPELPPATTTVNPADDVVRENVTAAVSTVASAAVAVAPKKKTTKELSIDDTVLESKRRSFEQAINKLMTGTFIPTPNRKSLSS